nr:MAG TPA: hypothetical protein [Caudoviricetes sp.]
MVMIWILLLQLIIMVCSLSLIIYLNHLMFQRLLLSGVIVD